MYRQISGKFLLTQESERSTAPKPSFDTTRMGRPPLTPSGRQRSYKFTANWCRDVLLGKVTDHDKLIAHAMELRLGYRTELGMMKFGELLQMVQTKLRKEILQDQYTRQVVRDMIITSKTLGVNYENSQSHS